MSDQTPGEQLTSQDYSAIELSMSDAHKKLAKLHDIQRASRMQLLFLIGALVLIMLIFGARIYGRVLQNFAHEKFKAQLLERLPGIGEHALRQLEPVLHEVAPVYGTQFKNRLVEIAPDLRDDADQLLKELPNQIHGDIMAQLEQSLNRVAVSIQKDTQKTFPYLTDDRAKDIMQHFVDALDRESQKVTKKAEGIFRSELQNVNDIFTRFEVPLDDKKDQDQVQRELIHHLLMYMDKELMAPEISN